MLKEFEVTGYRNFGTTLRLDLSDVRDYRFNARAVKDGVVKCGIVYGRNAVGKSNLCNAMFDIATNVGAGLHSPDDANYLNADTRASCATFMYLFEIDGHLLRYEYAKLDKAELFWEKLAIDGRTAFDFDHADGTLNGGDLGLVGGENLNWEFRGAGLSILRYICNNVPESKQSPIFGMYRFIRGMTAITDNVFIDRDYVSDLVDKIVKADRVGDLQRFLNRFGIDEPLAVKTTPAGERRLYFDKGRLVPFARNCSSGTVSLLRLFDSFELGASPTFVFVDEFDAFYHHDLAEAVVGYFKDRDGRQVLCASHNTDLFSNKVLRPDCLFILSPSGIVSAANATKRELREGHNLEKLYKAGEFDD